MASEVAEGASIEPSMFCDGSQLSTTRLDHFFVAERLKPELAGFAVNREVRI
jgi:hypothetical protein